MKTNVLRGIFQQWKMYLRYFPYQKAMPKNPLHDDIYVVAFPKSGVTWLSFILGNIELLLSKKNDEQMTFYNCHQFIPDIHQVGYGRINRVFPRTFIKSHSERNPYYLFVIYLIRNPIDTMVSYYNFLHDLGYKDDFYSFVLDSNYGITQWKQHTAGWLYRETEAQRMHFVRYEDLIASPHVEIKRIYQNLGVALDDKIIEAAIQLSSLSYMKKSESDYRKYNPNYAMSFVGKENKKTREDILTKDIEHHIFCVAQDEIEILYPELMEGYKL